MAQKSKVTPAKSTQKLNPKLAQKASKKAKVAPVVKVVAAKSAKGEGKVLKAKAVGKEPVKPVVSAKESKVVKVAQAKAALKKESDSAHKVIPPVVAAAPTPVAAVAVAKPVSAKAARGRARKLAIEASANEAASALAAKWANLFKKAEQIESKPYNMKASFEEQTAIVHKVLGWGYILANRNDRLEVLFKDGIKYLISNYKP